jgi:hypothetical protein
MVDSYREDFGERVYAWDEIISLSAIFTDITRDFHIWNAFEMEDVVITNISHDGGDNLSIDVPSFPYTLRPYDWPAIEMTIASDGDPTFEATVTVTTQSHGTFYVIVKGDRLTLLDTESYESDIVEELRWATKIIRGKNTSLEQRIANRSLPKQFYQIRFFFPTAEDMNRYYSKLHQWAKRYWGLPVWAEQKDHTATINTDDTVINVSTEYAQFMEDGFLLIWQPGGKEIGAIASLTTSSITLEKGVGATYTGSKLILPMHLCTIMNAVKSKQSTVGPGYIDLRLKVSSVMDVTGYTPPETYDSLTLLPPAIIEGNSLQGEIRPDYVLFDSETGLHSVRNYTDFNIATVDHGFVRDTQQDCWDLRQLVYSLKGRRGIALIPTGFEDMVLADTIGSADTVIKVNHQDLTANVGVNNLLEYVGVIKPDRTILVKHIDDITELDANTEQIHINSSLGEEVAVADICFVKKQRLASDNVRLLWSGVGRVECYPKMVVVEE